MNNTQTNASIIISYKPFYNSDTIVLSAIIYKNYFQISICLGHYGFQTSLYILFDIINRNYYRYINFIHSIYLQHKSPVN